MDANQPESTSPPHLSAPLLPGAQRPAGPPHPTLRLGDEAVPILSIQPAPTLVRVVHFRLLRWTITAIMRHWRPGDSGPGGKCQLCSRCTAYQDGCLKVVSGMVTRQDAVMLDTRTATRQFPVMT